MGLLGKRGKLSRAHRKALKAPGAPIVLERMPDKRALLGRTRGTGKQRTFETAVHPEGIWTKYNSKGRTPEQQARHSAQGEGMRHAWSRYVTGSRLGKKDMQLMMEKPGKRVRLSSTVWNKRSGIFHKEIETFEIFSDEIRTVFFNSEGRSPRLSERIARKKALKKAES